MELSFSRILVTTLMALAAALSWATAATGVAEAFAAVVALVALVLFELFAEALVLLEPFVTFCSECNDSFSVLLVDSGIGAG